MSEMVVFEQASKKETGLQWYSNEDQARFQQQFKASVHQTWEKLRTKPLTKISEDDLIECVGMEACMSSEVFKACRALDHTRSILEAQARQQASNVRDEVELARLSERSTEWARSRAQGYAAAYWDTLGK